MRGIFTLALLTMLCLPHSALAQQVNGKVRYLGTLPPVEYDKPYTGKLTIRRLATEEGVFATCLKAGEKKFACAAQPADNSHSYCNIYIANDNILKKFHYHYAFVLRHELGHCNGWSGDHKGGRKVFVNSVTTVPSLPADAQILPTYPPLVCVTPDWKTEPCTERKPDPPVRTWAEIYRYLYRTTWLRLAVYKRPVIDESVWELQVAKTTTGKNFVQRAEGNL
jgi:hypothetical protein